MVDAAPVPLLTAEELRILIQTLARRIRNERGDDTISDSQMGVLFHLKVDGPLSPGALAALEHVTPPSMTRTVNSLEQRGLVARHPNDDDARRVEVVLTPAGKDLLEATRRLRTEWFTRCLNELSPKDQALLEAAGPVLRNLLECK